MKCTYPVDGLTCAHCAAKIEEAIRRLDGVRYASVDVIGKKLIIEAEEDAQGRILRDAKRIMHSIEPSASIGSSDEQREQQEHRGTLIRIVVAAVLSVAIYLSPLKGAAKLLFFLVPYLLVGGDVLLDAGRNILHGRIFDEKFLMSIATIGAFALGEFAEGVAVMLFYQIGELFQDIAVGRSRRSIASLMDIRPDTVNVIRNGEQVSASPESVLPEEEIVILPGERVPLDAVVISGASALDTSALTGESIPRDAGIGDAVVSGSVNLSGVLHAKVTSTYHDSTVSRILDLVETSSENKSKTESFISKFARWYTPCVVIGAAALALIPTVLLGLPAGEWIRRALTFLVVSCPCALVISVPLSFFGGIGGASTRGILLKGAGYIETLSRVRTVVFDKTGTLTKGTFAVSNVHPKDISEWELLDLAAAAESHSHHPIADSIIRAHGGHIEKGRIGSVREIAGMGIEAEIDKRRISVGNERLMSSIGAKWKPCHCAGTIIHIARDGEYLGHIVISDEIKGEAKDCMRALRSLGVEKTGMLTGDLRKTGETIGESLGIDHISCELLPSDKVKALESLLSEGPLPLAYAGDGINDAPVLMRADVGIAMGALGSDAAIEAADVVIMDDSLLKIPEAIRISVRTMSIVRQNVWFALAVKALVLLLGAIGYAGMWLAVFADVGVMVLAILNATRAMHIKPE